METVKRLMGDEFQTLKHEIEVHFGRDSAHSSGDPQKLQVGETHEHKPETSSTTKNIHIENDRENVIQVDSGLQHADLSSVSSKSKSVSQSTSGIVTTTGTAEETHAVKETDATHNDSNEEGQVQVQERAFQILARGPKTPVVSSGSPGQYH